MKEFGGWQFPDGEEHLIEWMGKSNTNINGRLAYQHNKIEMALSHVRQWRRAVDCGAHIGLWSWHLAPRFKFIDAFEPMPSHRECFTWNIKDENVTLHPVALGKADGVARMRSYPGNSGHSHILEEGATALLGLVESPMRTLDSYGFDDVDFLKIDTEGYELEVLRGAVETLKRCKPTIIVEQKANNGSRYGYDDRAALPFLHDLGARVVAERARDYVLIWR